MKRLTFVLIFFVLALFASEDKVIIKQYSNFNNIYALLVDSSNKYIWQGSTGGLIKRRIEDGKIIKVFTTMDGLPSNDIRALEKDKNGNIWVATWDGIAKIEDNKIIQPFKNLFKIDKRFRAILIDKNNNIWIGSYVLGVFKMDEKGIIKTFTEDDGLPHNTIWALKEDNKGNIFVGTYRGLAKIVDDKVDKTFTENDGLPSNQIRDITVDSDNNIWVCTIKGIAKMTNNEVVDTGVDEKTEILSIEADKNDNIWIGSNRGLLKLGSDNENVMFKTTDGLIPYAIYNIVHDGSGNTWLGTWGGLTKINNDKVIDSFRENNGFISNYIYSLIEDKNGNIWAGGAFSGLMKIRNNRVLNLITTDNGLPDNSVYALEEDKEGNIWIGTYDSGLAKIKDDKVERVFTTKDGLSSNYIQNILSDSNNNLWIGTFPGLDPLQGGLIKMRDDKVIEIFNKKNKLFDNSINCLLEDNERNIWVGNGVYDGLVKIKDDEVITHFTTENGLSSNYVKSLSIDSRNIVLVGTSKALSVIMNNKALSAYSDKFSNIFTLTTDSRGNVWMRAYNKVEDKTQLIKIKNGEINITFSKEDGLPNEYIYSLLYTSIGTLWIGTQNGLAKITEFSEILHIIDSKQNIIFNWYLHKGIFSDYKIKYLALERGLSKNGNYVPVLDKSGNPIKFQVDYEGKSLDEVFDGYFSKIEGHIVVDEKDRKGYVLSDEVFDNEWLEGMSRYYRVVAVYEDEDGNEKSLYNSHESLYVSFEDKYKPRVDLEVLEGNNILVSNFDDDYTFTLKLSSLDRFEGEFDITTWSDSQNSIVGELIAEIEVKLKSISLKSFEEKYIEINLKSSLLKALIGEEFSINLTSNVEVNNLKLNFKVTDKEAIYISTIKNQTIKRASKSFNLKIHSNLVGKEVVIKDLVENKILKRVTLDSPIFETSLYISNSKKYDIVVESEDVKSNSLSLNVYKSTREIYIQTNDSLLKERNINFTGKVSPYEINNSVKTIFVKGFLQTDDGKNIRLIEDDIALNSKGEFNFSIYPLHDGVLSLSFKTEEDTNALRSNLVTQFIIGASIGQAVIFVADSSSTQNRENASKLGDETIKSLMDRGILKVSYLHYDSNHKLSYKNQEINTTKANRDNLRYILTKWIDDLHPDDPYKTPLTLYIIGSNISNSKNAEYYINGNEALSIDFLNEIIENLKSEINDKYGDKYKDNLPINLIVEGENSGSWIDDIKSNGAIFITSSNSNGESGGGYDDISNLAKSFTKRFYDKIKIGRDIQTSFKEAKQQVLMDFKRKQEPQVDSNADGYSNNEDDKMLIDKYLEYRPIANEPPYIVDAISSQNIDKNFSGNIEVGVMDRDSSSISVYLEITSPLGMSAIIKLTPKNANRFFTNFKFFSQKDIYKIAYYAKDDKGTYSRTIRGDYIVKEALVDKNEEIAEFKKLQESYLSDELKITLKDGWNLISNPLNAKLTDLNQLSDKTFYTFKDNDWSKNPPFIESCHGFWVKSDEDNLSYSGDRCVPNLNNLSNRWNLLGSGEGLNFNDINRTIWVFRENSWIKNPEYLDEGEGFWIK